MGGTCCTLKEFVKMLQKLPQDLRVDLECTIDGCTSDIYTDHNLEDYLDKEIAVFICSESRMEECKHA